MEKQNLSRCGAREPTQPCVRTTTSIISAADRWDHILARWGVNRSGHRVEPGLYALGNPTPGSHVFVTANYTLSFDALRSALDGLDGYILVLDTLGINVWCAAGKGTFGTDELVHRIDSSMLQHVVTHRELILPQLGAPGVSAHEVKKLSGYRVEYGPVRAADLPEYLKTRQATPEMRRVRFSVRDRVALIPVELVHILVPMLIAALVLYFLGGYLASWGAISAILSGVVLFPILLPWLPSRAFSAKGFILGGLTALPFAAAAIVREPQSAWWLRMGWAFAYLLALPPVTAYLALNFTGSSTFTSRSGVRSEMSAYIPVMAGTLSVGIVLTIILAVIRLRGG